MEVKLQIAKAEVMKEVAVTTAYTGGKMADEDSKAPSRISTVDEDEKHLERFWEECRADLCRELMGLVTFEGIVADAGGRQPGGGTIIVKPKAQIEVTVEPNDSYEVRLDVSNSFDEALLPSMKLNLFSYFVQGIAAKWYVYTNKKEAGEYADKAATLLDDLHRKALFKKRPTRPTYKD